MVITQVHVLIERFFEVNNVSVLTSHDRKQTALMYAAYYGYLDVVIFLVNHGANTLAQNECVMRPAFCIT
jgi:ankyrin repeat protein